MKPERVAKIKSVIRQSQPDLTVVLENIFDPLNISAVLRSCDAVGVREVFVVYTKPYLDKRGLVLGKRTSGGAFKWIDVYVFEDLAECFRRVKERYGRVLATALGEKSQTLYEMDLTVPTALLFGNEGKVGPDFCFNQQAKTRTEMPQEPMYRTRGVPRQPSLRVSCAQ
jgi:tRNA (guanosine-2'-O-)-methyltransferase